MRLHKVILSQKRNAFSVIVMITKDRGDFDENGEGKEKKKKTGSSGKERLRCLWMLCKSLSQISDSRGKRYFCRD